MIRSYWLLAGGGLSAIAALLHIGCIAGGPRWYRFFGAGERMARLAESGSLRPAIITLVIAATLAAWSAYGFAGAGVLPRLPLLRPALVAICVVYLLRAFALPVMLTTMTGRSATFLVSSSVVVLVFGVVHAIGIWRVWAVL